MAGNDEVKDITLQVLIDIREEIRALPRDRDNSFAKMDKRFAQMDQRFAQMDKHFERIEVELVEIRENIKEIVAHFDKDYLALANEMGDLKGRMRLCEDRLRITAEDR